MAKNKEPETRDYFEKPIKEEDLPHQILGLRSDASKDEIEKAYHKLAREYHPDRNRGREAEAGDIFRRLVKAQQTLLEGVTPSDVDRKRGGEEREREHQEQERQERETGFQARERVAEYCRRQKEAKEAQKARARIAAQTIREEIKSIPNIEKSELELSRERLNLPKDTIKDRKTLTDAIKSSDNSVRDSFAFFKAKPSGVTMQDIELLCIESGHLSPLGLALVYCRGIEIIKLLVEAKGNIKYMEDGERAFTHCPIYIAAKSATLEVVEYLYQQASKGDMGYRGGYPSLLRAAIDGFVKEDEISQANRRSQKEGLRVIQYLLNLGCSIDLEDEESRGLLDQFSTEARSQIADLINGNLKITLGSKAVEDSIPQGPSTNVCNPNIEVGPKEQYNTCTML